MRKLILLTTLAAAAVVAAGITVRAQTYGPSMMGNDQNYSNGLDVLERRYASGEINRDEYLQKKGDFQG